MTTPPLACVILAAGRGTRMKSDTPKLLHRACGRPVLEWVLDAIAELAPARTVVVVASDGDAVRAILPAGVEAATQERPLGTGDAARSARAALAGFEGDILVMNGDHPLTDPASLRDMAAARAQAGAAAAVLTFTRTQTIGADFGRIVRGPGGAVERIVELRDTTPQERALTEVNSGIYLFRSDLLLARARAARHGQRPGRALPDRRRRAAWSPTVTSSPATSTTTRRSRSGSTPAPISPPPPRFCATASTSPTCWRA